jgi:hypothetical protein
MTSAPSPNDPSHGDPARPDSSRASDHDGLHLAEVFKRLCGGLAQTLGLALSGAAIGAVICVFAGPFTSVTTSMRITFAFSGYGRGEYPDHSKFQPDDVRAPDIVADALTRQGLDGAETFASRIRSAMTIEGLIPANVIKERDRLRANGQVPASFIPDEYLVTLTVPHNFPLGTRQRELLLNEIVSLYQEKFQRTYVEMPVSFGSAFESLRNADFFEYEMILNAEILNISGYLNQQIDQAKLFRSPTTNLSFSDLLSQTDFFSQIRLSEALGLIRQNGLSSNRSLAMVKMDYYLSVLEDREHKVLEDEKVVDKLLADTQERSQNYVLGIKSQTTQERSETPILDQGLIDSLLANDAYNFLVRRALEAGLKVKEVQAEKDQLVERRKTMELFLKGNPDDQSVVTAQVQKLLGGLEGSYNDLISKIRKTHADYARQQFADAIRVSMQPTTSNRFTPVVFAGIEGGIIGVALGVGLSLLGIYIGVGENRRH